jgi:hypothetical protein
MLGAPEALAVRRLIIQLGIYIMKYLGAKQAAKNSVAFCILLFIITNIYFVLNPRVDIATGISIAIMYLLAVEIPFIIITIIITFILGMILDLIKRNNHNESGQEIIIVSTILGIISAIILISISGIIVSFLMENEISINAINNNGLFELQNIIINPIIYMLILFAAIFGVITGMQVNKLYK